MLYLVGSITEFILQPEDCQNLHTNFFLICFSYSFLNDCVVFVDLRKRTLCCVFYICCNIFRTSSLSTNEFDDHLIDVLVFLELKVRMYFVTGEMLTP